MKSYTMKTGTLFELLCYAAQQSEAGYGLGACGDSEGEEKALKRKESAVWIIADVWCGGDVKQATGLVSEFMTAMDMATGRTHLFLDYPQGSDCVPLCDVVDEEIPFQ